MISKEDYNKIKDFILRNNSISFILAMEEEGEVTLHRRTSQPCYGELRVYDRDKDGYSKPMDLHNPFPDGYPVALGVPFCRNVNSEKNSFLEFLVSKESPWRNSLPGLEKVYKGSFLKGFILLDTDFDPTPLVQMLLCSKNLPYHGFRTLVEKNIDPRIAFLASLGSACMGQKFYKLSNSFNEYSFIPIVDLDRFFNADPVTLTPDPVLFSQRAAYNRPKIARCFVTDKGVNIPRELSQFLPKALEVDEFIDKVVPHMTELCSEYME